MNTALTDLLFQKFISQLIKYFLLISIVFVSLATRVRQCAICSISGQSFVCKIVGWYDITAAALKSVLRYGR